MWGLELCVLLDYWMEKLNPGEWSSTQAEIRLGGLRALKCQVVYWYWYSTGLQRSPSEA